jgi:hypothetical protein
MPVGGAAIAGVLVLGGLGFGGGYAVAAMGGDDDGGPKPAAKSGDPALPAVEAPASKPKIVVVGSAPALPAPKRASRTKKSSRTSSPGPGPEPTAAPTSAPTAAPTSAPTSAPPPPSTPAPPDPDDIIEG